MPATTFVLLYHFAIAAPGFGAPDYAETVGPLAPEQCEQIATGYRNAKPKIGRNDVACIKVPDGASAGDGAQWYNYLRRTYLDMANCVQQAAGEPVPSSSAVRMRYSCGSE
jgi:hypothetical protein